MATVTFAVDSTTDFPYAVQSPVEEFTRSPERDEREEQLRAVFRIPQGTSLPRVDEESLLDYHHYLAGRLSLPFVASFHYGEGPHQNGDHEATVLELLRPKHHTATTSGLICLARKGSLVLEVPLAQLRAREEGPNHWLVEGYRHWIQNCQPLR